ncbi:MAG: hypothetical protein J6P46_04055, partial [Bacteroidales bacterium]|nr:hypothetical protein [Bacteroidales bacterium]
LEFPAANKNGHFCSQGETGGHFFGLALKQKRPAGLRGVWVEISNFSQKRNSLMIKQISQPLRADLFSV